MAIVRIPTPLRGVTGGRAVVCVAGGDLRTVLAAVEQEHPGLLERIVDADGQLRPYVHVFVAGEDVRSGEGLATRVGGDDLVSIVPAVAGGAAERARPSARPPAGATWPVARRARRLPNGRVHVTR